MAFWVCVCEFHVKTCAVVQTEPREHGETARPTFAFVFLTATLPHRSDDVGAHPRLPQMNGNTGQTRLQTNDCNLSVDNIDRTSARKEGSVQEPSLSDVNVDGHEARHESKV